MLAAAVRRSTRVLGDTVINSILRALFVRRAPSLQSGEAALLNYALDLAQEWGENWLRPIQPRLRKAYPRLPDGELDRLNNVAKWARSRLFNGGGR